MENLKQLAKVRDQALRELRQAFTATQTKDYTHWVTEQSVFYLHRIDWEYLIENEVERWLLEMKLWANKN